MCEHLFFFERLFAFFDRKKRPPLYVRPHGGLFWGVLDGSFLTLSSDTGQARELNYKVVLCL